MTNRETGGSRTAPTIFLFAVLLASLVIQSPPQPPPIAIASAFGEELSPLLSEVEGATSEEIGGVTFTTGTLRGRAVVLLTTDVSMVNAAMNTQRLIDHFSPSHLIYTGIGGGLYPDAQIGDVVVPAQWAQYGEAVYTRVDEIGAFQPPTWLDSPFAHFGMMFPKAVQVHGENHYWFNADAELLQTVTPQSGVIVGGNGVSGQAFVDNSTFAAYLYNTFDAQIVDMESGAVAQVAFANNLPFLIVRGVSDIPGITSEQEMRQSYKQGITNAAEIVFELLD
jgi:adenosylhomocysteine nucleosidase